MAKEILAQNLKALLDRKGKTQTEMAKDLNLRESTVSSWVNGIKYPRRDKIEMLADYFNVNPSDITEDKSISNKNNNISEIIAAHIDDDASEEEIEEILAYIETKRMMRRNRKK